MKDDHPNDNNPLAEFPLLASLRISADDLPHDAGDFRLVDRRILDALKEIDDYHPYLRGLIASFGFEQIGVPYRYGGNNAGGFDCSGLVQYAYANVGKSVPRTTNALWHHARPVANSDMQPGDILFFNIAGKIDSHQASSIRPRPSDTIDPQEAVGGCSPSPRNERPASRTMTFPIPSVAATMTGASVLGMTCLRMIRTSEYPSARAA